MTAAKQRSDMISDVRSRIEKTGSDLRDGAQRAGDSLSNGVKVGKKAVKEHPKAALGIALGATFAAGVIAGTQVSRMRKNNSKRKSS